MRSGESGFDMLSTYLLTGRGWIRHGLFTEFHRNGQLTSQGMYKTGFEEGSWQDFYETGQIAAEGTYSRGAEVDIWRYWTEDGIEEVHETRGNSPCIEYFLTFVTCSGFLKDRYGSVPALDDSTRFFGLIDLLC